MALTLSTDDFQAIARVTHGYKAVYFVRKDGNDGNDGLSPGTAFLTCGAAKSAASAGDMVFVNYGTYDETALHKSGVDWRFTGQAGIAYTGATGTALFGDGGVAMSYNVLGQGTFSAAGSTGGNNVFRLQASGTRVTCDANKVATGAGQYISQVYTGATLVLHADEANADGTAFDFIGGNGTIRVSRIIASSYSVEYDGGDAYIEADSIRSTGTNPAVTMNTGNVTDGLTIRAGLIETTGACSAVIENTAIDSNLMVEGATIRGTGTVTLYNGNGRSVYRGCRIEKTNTGTTSVDQAGEGTLLLERCDIAPDAAVTNDVSRSEGTLIVSDTTGTGTNGKLVTSGTVTVRTGPTNWADVLNPTTTLGLTGTTVTTSNPTTTRNVTVQNRDVRVVTN